MVMRLVPLTLTLSPLGRGDDKGKRIENLLPHRLGERNAVAPVVAVIVPSPQRGEGEGAGRRANQSGIGP